VNAYKSISPYIQLTSDQLGELFELIATNQISVDEAVIKYKRSKNSINRYLDHYYYGLIPKHRQKTVTLQSKINNDNYETIDHHRTGAIAV
jgi:hypothetical protein